MAKLNWQKARQRDQVRAADQSRTRPPAERRQKPWQIFVDPRPARAPPKHLQFRRFRSCWAASFPNRQAVMAAIVELRAVGWTGRAQRIAPDKRTSRRQDGNATKATKDRAA